MLVDIQRENRQIPIQFEADRETRTFPAQGDVFEFQLHRTFKHFPYPVTLQQ